jgi:CBS domain-containing membrane protein
LKRGQSKEYVLFRMDMATGPGSLSPVRATDRVDQYMTEAVLSINVDEPAGEVLRLFAGYPVHHLPVLSNQKVVGMLSSADVLKIATFIPKTSLAPGDYLSQHVQVATLMRKPAITIRPHATVLDAARLMVSHAVHALPVVNEEELLLGIITTTDIMAAALEPRSPAHSATLETKSRMPLKPQMSASEFEKALAAAKAAIAAGKDADGVAMGLLYLHQRLVALEHVLQSADRYLKLGQDPTQQATLRAAVAAAKRAQSTGDAVPSAF